MDMQGYAVIHQRAMAIDLQCTDPSFVEQILDTLAESIKRFMVAAWKLPTGELYRWRVYRLSEDVDRAWWLIVQQFCRRGWEPLENPSLSRGDPTRALSLKFRNDELKRELDLDSWYPTWSTAVEEAFTEDVDDVVVARLVSFA